MNDSLQFCLAWALFWLGVLAASAAVRLLFLQRKD